MRRASVVAIAAVASLLAGCSSASPDDVETVSTVETTPAVTYESITDMLTAYKQAGAQCDDADIRDDATYAEGMVRCQGGAMVLMVFTNQEARDENLAELVGSGVAIGRENDDVLVGPNWLLSGDYAGEFVEDLGGELRS
ncbi:MAG: hypothetical protein ACTJHU_03745 [Mycetocola sp.]